MNTKVATSKFAAATLAVLIGTSFAMPAFAQQGQPALGAKAAEQAAPKATDKAAPKVQQGADKADGKAKSDKAKGAPAKIDKKG
jgi:hypothetical protein